MQSMSRVRVTQQTEGSLWMGRVLTRSPALPGPSSTCNRPGVAPRTAGYGPGSRDKNHQLCGCSPARVLPSLLSQDLLLNLEGACLNLHMPMAGPGGRPSPTSCLWWTRSILALGPMRAEGQRAGTQGHSLLPSRPGGRAIWNPKLGHVK